MIRLSALYSNNPLKYFENLYYSCKQELTDVMDGWIDSLRLVTAAV